MSPRLAKACGRAEPRSWERGTVSAEACAGVAALSDYANALGDGRGFAGFYEAVAAAETAPLGRLLHFLHAAKAVEVVGAGGGDRLPTVAFSHARLAPATIVANARAARVALRCGDFLSPRLVAACGAGPGGVVRASLVHYNTLAEVDALCACLERMDGW